MAKDTAVIVLGVAIALTPFLGLPGIWKTGIIVLFALLIAIIGAFLRAERSFTDNQKMTVKDILGNPESNEAEENTDE